MFRVNFSRPSHFDSFLAKSSKTVHCVPHLNSFPWRLLSKCNGATSTSLGHGPPLSLEVPVGIRRVKAIPTEARHNPFWLPGRIFRVYWNIEANLRFLKLIISDGQVSIRSCPKTSANRFIELVEVFDRILLLN